MLLKNNRKYNTKHNDLICNAIKIITEKIMHYVYYDTIKLLTYIVFKNGGYCVLTDKERDNFNTDTFNIYGYHPYKQYKYMWE